MANLSTSPGDGSLQVGVDAFGSFGSRVEGGAGTSNAIFDPLGTFDGSGTSFESAVAIRLGNSGSRTFLTTGDIASSGLPDPGFDTQTINAAESEFSFDVLNFDLTQTAQDTFSNGERIGSLLTQTYVVTNTSDEAVSFDLLRYFDGDLEFDGDNTNGGNLDGGGRIFRGGEEILFQTNAAGESAESNTFVGITAEGGSTSLPGRYEIEPFSFGSLRSKILSGEELDDTIDNDNDGDGFIDADEDITLGFNNEFVLAPGESTTYTAKTIFGAGSAEEANPGDPEVIEQSLNRITGTSGNDRLSGTDEGDEISAGDGNDVLNGGAGDDILQGLGGRDVLDGGAGNDELDGGSGIDTAVYQFSSTGVSVNLANGTANAGESDSDVLIGIENIIASELDDNLVGDDGTNSLTGRDGNDVIDAAGGNDFVIGGEGADSLIGGSGRDTFVYTSAQEGGDTIEDFEVGVDKISPVSAVFGLTTGVLPGSRFVVDTTASDREQRFIYNDTTGDLFFDRDGNGSQGQQLIANVGAGTGLSSSDIQLL